MRRNHVFRLALVATTVGVLATLPIGAIGEKIDYDAINKIKAQGMQPQNSKVMEIASWLTDVYGQRLTGSPNTQKAADWAVGKLKEWGLQNVALDKWTDPNGFKTGWTNEKFYMAAVSPEPFPIPGTPTAWTAGTNGLVRGEVILVTETTQEDLQKYAGRLKGKWILTQAAPDVAAYWTAPASRTSLENLDKMELATPAGLEFGVTPPGAGRGGRQGAPAAVAAVRRGASTATTSSAPKGPWACCPRRRADMASTRSAAIATATRRPRFPRSRFRPSSTAAWRACSRRTFR